MKILNWIRYSCCALFLILSANAVSSESYPQKPVKIVIPYPPGGPTDVVGRLVADKLSKLFNQSVIVENKAGANGIIGTDLVAKSAADGYTLLLATSATSSNPSLYSNLPFDTSKDFSPVSMLGVSPVFLWSSVNVPAKDVQELIALAKQNPGGLTFASAGAGGTPHLSGELFKMLADVDLLHVPYKGAAPAIVDLVGGRVDLYFGGMAAPITHFREGKLNVLGVAQPQRSTLMPDVPTMAEQGLPDYTIVSWFGLFAPANVSDDIVNKLADAISKIGVDAGFKESLTTIGFEPRTNNPQEFSAFFTEDVALWSRVVTVSNVKLQ